MALEAIANRPQKDHGDARALVADLEARMSSHVVAHQQAIADLQTRSPPEADLLRRIIALEAEKDGLTKRINSLQGKVYREATKTEKKIPSGILGHPSQPFGAFRPNGVLLGAPEQEAEPDGTTD